MPVQISVDGLCVHVTYKRIKNMYLRVLSPDGRVCVSAPCGMPQKQIVDFVRSRRAWVDRQSVACCVDRPRLETGEELQLWGEHLPLTVTPGRTGVQRTPEGLCLSVPNDADTAARVKAIAAFYRAELETEVPPLLAACERIAGVKANEWRIKTMKTRWGSCNTVEKRIWLNLHLAEKPPECLRYVILHELCHLHERGHGAAFWERMDAYCPDWRQLRKRLNGKDPSCI